MAPVQSFAQDHLVPQPNEMIALWVTIAIAVVSVGLVVRYCMAKRIWWPMIVVVGGLITCLQEPLYDHLYGLWFFEQGQLGAFTTYGIHVPLWLPVIYIAYYGANTVWYWHRLESGWTIKNMMAMFAVEVLLAGLAEEFYINAVGLYNYQDNQPFYILNYPIFVAIVNGVPPTLGAIIIFKLKPHLDGWKNLLLLFPVSWAFAANSFGSGFLYLSARHATPAVSQPVLYLAAATAAIGSIVTIWAALKMAGVPQARRVAQTSAPRRAVPATA
ncbi:hypothetical protein [Novosphingobium sp. 9U]|uniref:hypothetical protein n=1 Tax=Novosphingobium sp. 9U TaxID=2653158 RepID=UPI0012F2BA2E|nr:hypothetical protein [Novosphingobium sp. 9U]VWX50179.1 conserved membrane hypothetical protein [Novosphingobium sp. 9U]